MSNLLDTMDSVLLMGPGPSSVHPRVYQALAKPTIGHLDPQFWPLWTALKKAFGR